MQSEKRRKIKFNLNLSRPWYYETGGEKAQKFWTDSTNYYNELLSTMLEKKFPNIKFMFNNIRTTARSEDKNQKT